MKRREFLRNITLVASLPVVVTALARQVSAEAQMNFHFSAISFANTLGNVRHSMLMVGDGKWDAENVSGGGGYNHFDDASPAPKTLLEYGTWEATGLRSWSSIGGWGIQTAGVLDMDVNLKQVFPSPAVIDARFQLVCNAGPAKLFNPNPNPPPANLPEGFTLDISGKDYGPFLPQLPPVGLTFFTSGERVEDRALDKAQADLQNYLPLAAAVPSLVAAGLGLLLIRTRRKEAH